MMSGSLLGLLQRAVTSLEQIAGSLEVISLVLAELSDGASDERPDHA